MATVKIRETSVFRLGPTRYGGCRRAGSGSPTDVFRDFAGAFRFPTPRDSISLNSSRSPTVGEAGPRRPLPPAPAVAGPGCPG